MPTLYRRPLPTDAVAFSSTAGREIFAEALASGGLGGYFPLAEQFHTQSDPSFCGLGSLVVALNALGIDPERLWKGPWRWFAEDLLDCCVPLSEVRQRGLDIDELACLARCNGAEVDVVRATETNLDDWREFVCRAAKGDAVLIASYDRASLGQTGSGHFSPVGGYHATRDLALILDVARFKYPPHWVSAQQLWRAMQPADPETGRPRGWILLRRRATAGAVGFNIHCLGGSWQALAARIRTVTTDLKRTTSLVEAATMLLPLVEHLEIRKTSEVAHEEALGAARNAVLECDVYRSVVSALGARDAERVAVLVHAVDEYLPVSLQSELSAIAEPMAAEVSNLRAQLRTLSVGDHRR